MKVELRADTLFTALSAVAPFVAAATGDRQALACVHVRTDGPVVVFTATNSYALGRYTVSESEPVAVVDAGEGRIPTHNVKAVLDMLKPLAKIGAVLVTVVANGALSVSAMGSTVACDEVPWGEYPNLDSIMKSAESTGEQSVAGFNPAYLCQFGKVAKVLDRVAPTMRLHFTSTGLVKVTFGDDYPFVGLIQQVKV